MTVALALAMVLAADGGTEGPGVVSFVERVRGDVCPQMGERICSPLAAFSSAKPLEPKELFAIGYADLFDARAKRVEASAAYVLWLKPQKGGSGKATLFRIVPENADEERDLEAFIASCRKGTPDRSSALFKLMMEGVKQQKPHDTRIEEQSLFFETGGPLSGQWVRASGKTVVLFGFAGRGRPPPIVAAELYPIAVSVPKK